MKEKLYSKYLYISAELYIFYLRKFNISKKIRRLTLSLNSFLVRKVSSLSARTGEWSEGAQFIMPCKNRMLFTVIISFGFKIVYKKVPKQTLFPFKMFR